MYTVSARKKQTNMPLVCFLANNFSDVFNEIESVFGFSDFTPLYGGRFFVAPELSEEDLAWMYTNGIGYRIPLTNKFPTQERYEASLEFLKKHEREGNTIITSSVWLARQIREDFPLYKIESSVMMKPMSQEEIKALLEVFDSVVLHPSWYSKKDMPSLENKDRLVWFTALGCLFNCPDDSCQRFFSRHNIGAPQTEPFCSQDYMPREDAGFNYLNIEYLKTLGFSRFKMMRENEAPRKGPIKCLLPRKDSNERK